MSLNASLSVSVTRRLPVVEKLATGHYCNCILQAELKQIFCVHEQPAINLLAVK